MTDDLVKRLREVGGISDSGATRWYINPDGPEAASRIEMLEAALEVYSCSCSIADEDDCELGDWANISCGYRARKALEGKDD